MSPQKSSQIENFAALNRLCHPGLTFGILCYWRIFVYKYIWLHKNGRHKPSMMSLEFCIWTSEGQLGRGMFDSCRNPNKHFPSISQSANTIKNLTDILQLKIRAATFPLIIPFINALRLSLPNLQMRLKWHDDHILQKIIKTPDEKRYQLIITILVLFLPRWNLRYRGPFFIGVVPIYRTKSIRYEKKTLELRTGTVKRGINSTTPRLTEEL